MSLTTPSRSQQKIPQEGTERRSASHPEPALRHLVISCSLSPTSRSAQLAELLAETLTSRGASVEVVDLRTLDLPPCDGGAASSHPEVVRLAEKIGEAHSVTLAVPVYNYDVGAAARDLIANTGAVWTEKVVGFIGAAGGDRSFMSLIGLANSLMLDFRSVVVPRYLYASRADFAGGPSSPEIESRLAALAGDLVRFAAAFHGMRLGQGQEVDHV